MTPKIGVKNATQNRGQKSGSFLECDCKTKLTPILGPDFDPDFGGQVLSKNSKNSETLVQFSPNFWFNFSPIFGSIFGPVFGCHFLTFLGHSEKSFTCLKKRFLYLQNGNLFSYFWQILILVAVHYNTMLTIHSATKSI